MQMPIEMAARWRLWVKSNISRRETFRLYASRRPLSSRHHFRFRCDMRRRAATQIALASNSMQMPIEMAARWRLWVKSNISRGETFRLATTSASGATCVAAQRPK
jgi:hypothetical protein